MIWPNSFASRLASWNLLRDQCQNLSTQSALERINRWWLHTPWRPYYLHWDDVATWPDPWQLLSDDIYCDVARGLGILYTITLLERPDLAPVELVLTQDDVNLVLVAKEKYILNWAADTVVNTIQAVTIKRKYQQRPIT